MDLNSILDCLQHVGHFGHVVSTEEQVVLHNSLLILQNENHFRNVFFWGKILGAERDYFVAYGYVKDALHGRVYYYSRDCVNWGLLPKPSKDGFLLTPLCTSRFQGDPALITDILIDKDDPSLGVKLRKAQIKKLKEEDRLASFVTLLSDETAIVPRGGLFQRPDGVVVENLAFEGLNVIDSRELASFLHYRTPTRKYNTNLLTKDDYNYAIDFLDPLDIDIPEGCWTVHLTSGNTIVLVKSLYWPGFIFYHYLKTPRHGFVYIGHGKKCLDLPFMISPFI